MGTHHCTCEECERRRQQAGDEAFADMVVLAHYHPEWFMFGDRHGHEHGHGHHETGAYADDDLDHDDGVHHDDFVEDFDDMDGFDSW